MANDRPWLKMIVKHTDGIMLFAVYMAELNIVGNNKWQVIAKYRGLEKDTVKIDKMAQSHIDDLSANIFGLLTASAAIDLNSAVDEFYAGKRKSVDYDSFPADGQIKLLGAILL